MELQILKAGLNADAKVWRSIWDRLPEERKDVYFLPEYLFAYEIENRGEALCAIFINKDAIWMYPFMRSKITVSDSILIEEDYFDIQTPYGYGGPLVNSAGEDKNFITAAWQCFSEWCCKTRVVSEFCRFHPLLSNHLWADDKMEILKNRDTVAMDLIDYPTAVWGTSYFRNHREMIRKAMREGFIFQVENFSDQLSWFAKKYNETQASLNADSETFFSEDYFKALHGGLSKYVWLGVVRKDGIPVTAVLVLEGRKFAYLHLMAYFNEGPAKGMVNYLYHEAALQASKHGLTQIQVGGGKTNSPDDPLFLFKTRLSPVRHTFYIGKRIHDLEGYQKLSEVFISDHGVEVFNSKKNILQFYR